MAAWFILPPSLQIVCVCLYLCRFVCCLSGLSALSIVNSFVVTCVSCGVVSSSSSANRAKKNELLSFFLCFFFLGFDWRLWYLTDSIENPLGKHKTNSLLLSRFSIRLSDRLTVQLTANPTVHTDRQTDRQTMSMSLSRTWSRDWPSSQMGVADCDSGKRVNNSSEGRQTTAK